MGLDEVVTKYANQSLIVQAYTGIDQYGSPTFAATSAATTYPCLIIPRIQTIRNKDGVEKVSTVQIFLAGSASVVVEDKITLPDATQPLILSVQKYPTFTGTTDIVTQVFT